MTSFRPLRSRVLVAFSAAMLALMVCVSGAASACCGDADQAAATSSTGSGSQVANSDSKSKKADKGNRHKKQGLKARKAHQGSKRHHARKASRGEKDRQRGGRADKANRGSKGKAGDKNKHAIKSLQGGDYPPKPDGIERSVHTAISPAVEGGTLRGLIALKQKGNRLTGEIVVHGLKPGAVHAAHIHGPLGSCAVGKFTGRHAAEFADLVADANGVATQKFDVKVSEQILGQPGYFVMVHQNPSGPSCHSTVGGPIPETNPAGPANPKIGCADIPVR